MDSERAQTWIPDEHENGFPMNRRWIPNEQNKWIPDENKNGFPMSSKNGFPCNENEFPCKENGFASSPGVAPG
eukprot:671596-Lingulodinium_polyedra.AAC.1